MTRRSPAGTTLVAAVLLAALMLFCLGDLVHAAAMSDSEGVDHGGRLCSEHGCQKTALGTSLSLPMVTTTPNSLVAAAAVAALPGSDETPAAHHDQVGPRAPRSPPIL